jgi:hypothetical protein
MSTERITKAVSIDSDLAQWAEERASSENRSFSNYVETLLIRLRDENGNKKPPQKSSKVAA